MHPTFGEVGRENSTFASLGENAAIAAITAVMAVVGGATSAIAGGKFANGAILVPIVSMGMQTRVYNMINL